MREQIITGSNCNVIKSGNDSNIFSLKNIIANNLSNIIDEFIDQPRLVPGDTGICPDGSTRIVGRDGRFYCNIDPDGDGLYPGTTVKCSNGKTTRVNNRGNIIGGCTPANGSEVTCLADFETIVENDTWSCAQGGGDENTIIFSSRFYELKPNAYSILLSEMKSIFAAPVRLSGLYPTLQPLYSDYVSQPNNENNIIGIDPILSNFIQIVKNSGLITNFSLNIFVSTLFYFSTPPIFYDGEVLAKFTGDLYLSRGISTNNYFEKIATLSRELNINDPYSSTFYSIRLSSNPNLYVQAGDRLFLVFYLEKYDIIKGKIDSKAYLNLSVTSFVDIE